MKNYLLLIFLGLFFCSCMPMPNAENKKLSFRAPNSITEAREREDYASELQMAPRTYIVSTLMEAFSAKGTPSEAYINTNVGRMIEFGGGCDQYEPSDKGSATAEYPEQVCYNSIGVVQKSTNNPMRYAIMSKVCETLVVDRLGDVRNKLFGASWPVPATNNIGKAWELFYQAEQIDERVAKALIDISKQTSSNEKAWQAIILATCMSPQWQVF